jgi:hypothetical protein
MTTPTPLPTPPIIPWSWTAGFVGSTHPLIRSWSINDQPVRCDYVSELDGTLH